MIRIYKDHLKGSHHFSRVFLYIILHLCNKANFFKKRSEKNNLFNNCEKAFCLQKRIINEKKNRSKKLKKSVVVHFATSEISYFYFHYFLYIVLPKLHFLADYEKKKIIDNLYLINTNITDEDIQGHLYNKINEEGKCCSIIFCNDILPKEKYNYNNSLTIFLENASFLNIFVNLYQRKRMKKAPQLLIRKDQKRHISCAKSQYYNFNRGKHLMVCNNCLYMFYFTRNHFNKCNIIIHKRNKNLRSFTIYDEIIKNINTSVQWARHYSFYKFYYTAYVSFLNHRINTFHNIMNMVINNKRQKKKKNILYLFFKYKKILFNSSIFYDFINKKFICIDFCHAANLYIEFLKVQDRVNAAAGPNNCKTSFHYRINGRDEKRNFNKKDLVKEMKNNLNIYVWSSHQKENFYSSLVKMKFRKFYN
ncbi:conserved Plasmodium protein, unknown function [Plasmodium malariae]|uniref:Uncharacterized protein n=1 Tax=Plasmodium malariae TaxID=5858 RepID=A0A1D3JMI1_PLAMA|nr:conserved Plasmodium protein, unknown function [Plasmodium malariae]SBT87868.1 conserved Plasmodium protein, unknown function [Plasmodium malariae]